MEEKFMVDWKKGDLEVATEVEEDNGFYEDIQAPKFVDFTVPERSRPDDRSWFCARIGCDQDHEEVDAEALYKSFVLRVMSARSPNVRLRKAMEAPSSIPKYPQSAPAKPAKSRMMMSSFMTSIPEKMVKTRVNDHPIAKLRSTPSCTKGNVPYSTIGKAFTTPRNKRCLTKPESFRSVSLKNKTALAGAPKNKNVAKVLFADSDKETSEVSTPSKSHTTLSDVCAEMKKLKIGGLRKIVPSRYLDISKSAKTSKKTEESINNLKSTKESSKSLRRTDDTTRNLKKKNARCSQACKPSLLQKVSSKISDGTEKDDNLNNLGELTANAEENLPSSAVILAKESLQSMIAGSRSSNNSEAVINLGKLENCNENTEKVLSAQVSEIQNAADTIDYDDNKENASATDGTRDKESNTRKCLEEKRQSVTTETFSEKICQPHRKSCKQPSDLGAKNKKTTSTKPFRLRTDERGILKEANMESRFQTKSKRETEPVLKKEGCCKVNKQNGKSSQERLIKIGLDRVMQKTQHDRPYSRGKPERPADSKLIPAKFLPWKSFASKERMGEKLHNKVGTLQLSCTVTSSKKPLGSHMRKERSKTTDDASTLRGRRPTRVPKEPNFHHLPKGLH